MAWRGRRCRPRGRAPAGAARAYTLGRLPWCSASCPRRPSGPKGVIPCPGAWPALPASRLDLLSGSKAGWVPGGYGISADQPSPCPGGACVIHFYGPARAHAPRGALGTPRSKRRPYPVAGDWGRAAPPTRRARSTHGAVTAGSQRALPPPGPRRGLMTCVVPVVHPCRQALAAGLVVPCPPGEPACAGREAGTHRPRGGGNLGDRHALPRDPAVPESLAGGRLRIWGVGLASPTPVRRLLGLAIARRRRLLMISTGVVALPPWLRDRTAGFLRRPARSGPPGRRGGWMANPALTSEGTRGPGRFAGGMWSPSSTGTALVLSGDLTDAGAPARLAGRAAPQQG